MSDRFGRKAFRSNGFTAVELLAGLTFVGFLAIFTNNVLHTPRPDQDLQAAAYGIAALIKQASQEATTRGVTTVVKADLEQGEIIAFAEVNGSSSRSNPNYKRYLVFDPDPALHAARQTDYEIARLRLPEGVVFASGSIPATQGLTTLPHSRKDDHALVFLARGRIVDAGSLRLMDPEGRNVLEAAMLDLTGQVTIRKHLRAADAPDGQAGFFAEFPYIDSESEWAWY